MKQHYNTDFNIKNVNEKVTLYGWVQKKKKSGEEESEQSCSLMKFCCEGDKTPQFINSLSQDHRLQ